MVLVGTPKPGRLVFVGVPAGEGFPRSCLVSPLVATMVVK